MKRQRPCPDDYAVGWVCALPIELAAAQEMLDEEHEDLPRDDRSNDTNLYTLGRIGKHNVVIACLPAGQMGTHTAAAVAIQMKSKFTKIRFGLMVGIGGGVPSDKADIRLGDVVISQPDNQHGGVVQYDFGKAIPGGFQRTGSLNTPPTVLLNALQKLQANRMRNRSSLTQYLSPFNSLPKFALDNVGPDILFEPTYGHCHQRDTCEMCRDDRKIKRNSRVNQEVVVHYGTIASGNQVMRDGITRDKVSSELGDVLCFEMEAAGLINSFPCLVIRGICDYADSHKNKQWQPYAAATAAACAKEILMVIPETAVDTMQLAKDAVRREENIRSAIDRVELDPFLSMLPVFDHEEYKFNSDEPKFSWIFQNIDFQQWKSSGDSQAIWLCGPPNCSIDQASLYIVEQEKSKIYEAQRFVLYFFCSLAMNEMITVAVFVHTLLRQVICGSPVKKRILIIKRFLLKLLGVILEENRFSNLKLQSFEEADQDINIKKILGGPSTALWAALETVLYYEQQELLVVVDGLDKVQHQKSGFIRGIRTFIEHLQERMPKVHALLTSRPQPEIKECLDGLPCIEFDKERKECLASLRFDNTRYSKISREHDGSFKWIWAHNEYKDWSTPNTSQLLYIQGKPGSGKSTLAKYFSDNLLVREVAAKSAITAKFFYSYREGGLQTSHYSMLRSILHDILDQDKYFFYHKFQLNYRDYKASLGKCQSGDCVDWPYDSLKSLLLSLQDYTSSVRIYLIIDAIDESDEQDRREILNLLFGICSNTKYCIVKVFIASRPVGQLELRRSRFDHFIRLQDETISDITSFAYSFLKDLNLELFLTQAMRYIVENAQGVFLWVQLVGGELVAHAEEGYAEEDIFEFLKSLPTELEDFYTLMLKKIKTDQRTLRDGVKLFQFVLFAGRALTENELLHTLGVPDDPSIEFKASEYDFRKRIPPDLGRRIIHCAGNFLEIRPHHGNGTVQVIHQTVREFFLRCDGCVANSDFRLIEKDPHRRISITCIRYLMLCVAHTTLANGPPNIMSWTSQHFEDYAQYLHEMPFATYALCYLKYHLYHCGHDSYVMSITSKFISELTTNPAAYLLDNWVNSHLDKTILDSDQSSSAKKFRDNVLRAAVQNGLSTASEILLMVGASVNARDQEGRTPLSIAAERGNETVFRVLENLPYVNADSEDSSGQTPLSRAAVKGHEAVIRLLLERSDTNADSKDGDGLTPLCWAVESRHEAVVELLLTRNDVDVNVKDKYGRSMLSRAASRGHEGVVRLLLTRKDVDVDSKDDNGQTPLSWAAEGGHEAVVSLLLSHNVDANSKDKFGRTPLSWAAEKGHAAVVRLLLQRHDVEANTKDNYGSTPLRWALKKKKDAVVNLLMYRSPLSGSKS